MVSLAVNVNFDGAWSAVLARIRDSFLSDAIQVTAGPGRQMGLVESNDDIDGVARTVAFGRESGNIANIRLWPLGLGIA